MVAKINRGASLYGAIIYNQQKVNEDTARIIAGNRMITDSLYDPDRIVRQTMFAFESYLAAVFIASNSQNGVFYEFHP